MNTRDELRKIAEMFHLWDMGYTLEAIDHVMYRADLTEGDRVELAKAVLDTHFEHRVELAKAVLDTHVEHRVER